MDLDDALSAWAADVRLPDATAADIYRRIVATPTPAHEPPALDPAWWRQFTTDFTARIITSTRPNQWAA